MQAAAPPTQYECASLVVAASDLDLGDVWEGKEFVHELPIRNPLPSEVKVEGFVTSCLCTAVEPRTLTIAPGQTATVRVHIDPTHRSPDEISTAVRPFEVGVAPVLQTSSPRQAGWRIHGLFKSRVTLSALSVPFGQSIIQGAPPATRDVRAVVHVPMRRVEAAVDPAEAASVQVVPVPDAPDRWTIHIAPSNTLPVGPCKAVVTVNVVDPSGQVLPGAFLPISGDVQPEARLLPARVFLGAHPVGTTAETVVVLQAPAESAWVVDHIETDSADVIVEATTPEGVPAGRAFRVKQTATREGTQTDTVRFIVRKGGGRPMTLTMEVMCLGQLPGRAATPPDEGRRP